MRGEVHHRAIEAVAAQARLDRQAEKVRGFVIVKWMERYSYFLTPIPHADLETIVNAQTRADIVARYVCVDGVWQQLPLAPGNTGNHDGSIEHSVDGSK